MSHNELSWTIQVRGAVDQHFMTIGLRGSIENSNPKSDQWYLDWFVGENLNRKLSGFDHHGFDGLSGF